MRKQLLFLFILSTLFISAQKDNALINKSFNAYAEKIENKDFTKAIKTYLADDFLKFIPVESMQGELVGYTSTDEYESTLKNFKVIKISEIMTETNTKYALIRYIKGQVITIHDSMSAEKVQRFKDFHSKKHGKNYSFNAKTNVITNKSASLFIGVKKESQHWKFIPYQEKMNPFLSQLMPEKIAKVIVLRTVTF